MSAFGGRFDLLNNENIDTEIDVIFVSDLAKPAQSTIVWNLRR